MRATLFKSDWQLDAESFLAELDIIIADLQSQYESAMAGELPLPGQGKYAFDRPEDVQINEQKGDNPI